MLSLLINNAVITAKSATSHDIEDGNIISGIPAFDNRDWLRSIARSRRLGEMARTLRELEKRLTELENPLNKLFENLIFNRDSQSRSNRRADR